MFVRLTHAVLTFVVLTGAALTVTPARAALPPLSCGIYEIAHRYGGTEPLGFCVAFENGRISAGMKNNTRQQHPFLSSARVELTYFAFDQFPNGGNHVLEMSNPMTLLYANEVLKTPLRSNHWLPGIYCARIYELPPVDRWRDMHCVDTNGVVHR